MAESAMSENKKVTFGYAQKPDADELAKWIDLIPPNQLSNGGELNKELSQQLHRYLKLSPDREVVLCSSGHTALMAAYAVSKARSILVPAFTFESTRCAATLQNIEVEYADVGTTATGCLDITSVLSTTAQAIVVVCALSNIPYLKELSETCSNLGKTLIIDGAASFGTPEIYNFGDFFCLSFHGTKTFPIGEGGAVICNKRNALLIKQFINFGFDSSRVPVMQGLNAKLSEYSCAIGLAVWPKVMKEISHKNGLRDYWSSQLRPFCSISSVKDTVYQSFPLFFPDKNSVEIVRTALDKHNIEYKQYYLPLVDLPITRRLYETNICLPCNGGVNRSTAEQIVNIIQDAYYNRITG